MASDLLTPWRDAFMKDLEAPEVASGLQVVADGRRLRQWTVQLTAAVVRSCQAMGWDPAARAHALANLPQVQSEYLNLDVTAFPRGPGRWRMPLAAFELENSPEDTRVAYSLWKLLCFRAPLRVVFAYRQSWDQAHALIEHLQEQVIQALPLPQRQSIGPGVAVMVGSRRQESFPWGYFRLWRLDPGVNRFSRG